MGLSEGGDFTFDFSAPPGVVNSTGINDNTDKTSLALKLLSAVNYVASRDPRRRDLQTAVSQRLSNPVICVSEGDVLFFTVDAEKKQYPRYFKNNILNTNPYFDYGPFKSLERMLLQQNVSVSTFSFVFKEAGIYVFENAGSGTVTIVGVAGAGQQCQGQINGIGASMVTKESLDAIGI